MIYLYDKGVALKHTAALAEVVMEFYVKREHQAKRTNMFYRYKKTK